MRAFAIDEFGAGGSVHEVLIPQPSAGEVLVAVHVAGVNVMDPLYAAMTKMDIEKLREAYAGIPF